MVSEPKAYDIVIILLHSFKNFSFVVVVVELLKIPSCVCYTKMSFKFEFSRMNNIFKERAYKSSRVGEEG